MMTTDRRARGVHRDRDGARDMNGPRRCARCTETKPTTEYRRDSRGYWRSWCNPCQLAATREWKARNRDALLERRRAAREAAFAEEPIVHPRSRCD